MNSVCTSDSISPTERTTSPSKLSRWWDCFWKELLLQHYVKEARNELDAFQAAADALPEKRDKLYALLDHQRKCGFPHTEELHWIVPLLNWPSVCVLLVIIGTVIWLTALTR